VVHKYIFYIPPDGATDKSAAIYYIAFISSASNFDIFGYLFKKSYIYFIGQPP